MISSIKASGLSTNVWASESGLSSTMAIRISPPSFLMRAVLPSCILFKIATALFLHTFRSHSSTALWAMACFRFHVPFVPDCFVRPLGCFAVDFGRIPFHIVFAKQII